MFFQQTTEIPLNMVPNLLDIFVLKARGACRDYRNRYGTSFSDHHFAQAIDLIRHH